MDDFIGGNNYKQTMEQQKTKKWMKIIAVILVVLLIISIAMGVYIYYLKQEQLKIIIDGTSNAKTIAEMKKILIITEDGKIYIPIRAFASYVGYESGNGGYKQYSEDATKCYVQSANEVATFTLGSNRIYKMLLDGSNDTEYYEIDEPVLSMNNQLYTTIEGARIAFNISMNYDQEVNKIEILTLPYLVSYYNQQFPNSGIMDGESSFKNQKALLYGMIIIKNAENNYGVYNYVNKTEVLGTKYANIEFIESTQEFIVTTLENKMGIMLSTSSTKITPEYDNIKQIDKNAGLYLATNNNKKGIINGSGSIIVYLEYDNIGIDATNYANEVENQYLLYDKYIPVCKNNKWSLFDTTGRKVTMKEYDALGCKEVNGVSNGDAKPVLLIKKYEGIVVKDGEFYGVIDGQGRELVSTVVQNIYSITDEEEITYNMTYNNQTMNVLSYIEEVLKLLQGGTNSQNINENVNNNENNLGDINNNNSSNENNNLDNNNIDNENNNLDNNNVDNGNNNLDNSNEDNDNNNLDNNTVGTENENTGNDSQM